MKTKHKWRCAIMWLLPPVVIPKAHFQNKSKKKDLVNITQVYNLLTIKIFFATAWILLQEKGTYRDLEAVMFKKVVKQFNKEDTHIDKINKDLPPCFIT